MSEPARREASEVSEARRARGSMLVLVWGLES